MILAVSTHSNNIQIAVKSSENIYLKSLNAKVSQSKKILHMIDATLEDAGASKKDISSLYINSGPGMFTSLRVGIACINAISFVLKIPIYQFTTFDLYAVSAFKKNIKFQEDFDLKDLLEFKIQNVKETKIAKPYYLRNQVTS